jgi:hypothetical protein
MKWISVTNPIGGAVWINTEQAVRVRAPDTPKEHERCTIDLATGIQTVRESIDEVMRLIQRD